MCLFAFVVLLFDNLAASMIIVDFVESVDDAPVVGGLLTIDRLSCIAAFCLL